MLKRDPVNTWHCVFVFSQLGHRSGKTCKWMGSKVRGHFRADLEQLALVLLTFKKPFTSRETRKRTAGVIWI